MRITGGVLKGRSIKCPDGIIRPAMDKMKESVFSILSDITDLSFLDLFSGSGSIALEASSRGANPVTLVEKDRIKIDIKAKKLILEEKASENINPAQTENTENPQSPTKTKTISRKQILERIK